MTGENPARPLPGQPRDAAGPVFKEPWEAQAFALTLELYEAGYFTWREWAETLGAEATLCVVGHELRRARAFSDLPAGAAFWYENANGLAEIAVNQGRAAEALGLALGAEVEVTNG